MFGSTPNRVWQQPSPSLFSTPPQQKTPQSFVTPNTSGGIFGSQPTGGLSATPAGSLLTPSTNFCVGSTQHHSSQDILASAEISAILSHLSNADIRSYQVLVDTSNRLNRFLKESPTLISFTYEAILDSNSLGKQQAALEQELMQLNNQTLIDSYTSARRHNPDPIKYAITPLNNFEGLVQRSETQLRHMDCINGVLVEFKARQERIGNHLKIATAKRLSDILKRQKCLESSLIRVVGLLEEFAIRNSRAQFDVAFLRRLRDDITAMSDQLHESSAGRSKLNELRDQLCRLGEIVGLGGSKSHTVEEAPQVAPMHGTIPALSDNDFKIISNIITKQQSLFESLGSDLQQDLAKIKKLQQLPEGLNTRKNKLHDQRQISDFNFATTNSSQTNYK